LVDALVDTYCSANEDPSEWNTVQLREEAAQMFGLDAEDFDGFDPDKLNSREIREFLWNRVANRYREKERTIGREVLALPADIRSRISGVDEAAAETASTPEDAGHSILAPIERNIMLQVVDTQWKDHLYSLDHLKEGIGLRGYGQRDPLVEYKKESFSLFQDMKERIDEETVRYLWRIRPVFTESPAAPPLPPPVAVRKPNPLTFSGGSTSTSTGFGASTARPTATASPFGGPPRPARTGGDDVAARPVRRDEPKVGRNEPCPCGSGKKYKKCHGAGL
jgi:preprotein translocase subunit SecA